MGTADDRLAEQRLHVSVRGEVVCAQCVQRRLQRTWHNWCVVSAVTMAASARPDLKAQLGGQVEAAGGRDAPCHGDGALVAAAVRAHFDAKESRVEHQRLELRGWGESRSRGQNKGNSGQGVKMVWVCVRVQLVGQLVGHSAGCSDALLNQSLYYVRVCVVSEVPNHLYRTQARCGAYAGSLTGRRLKSTWQKAG